VTADSSRFIISVILSWQGHAAELDDFHGFDSGLDFSQAAGRSALKRRHRTNAMVSPPRESSNPVASRFRNQRRDLSFQNSRGDWI
jgi:hypothetical protein